MLANNVASLNTNPNYAPCMSWGSFGLYFSADDTSPNYDKASTSSQTVICAAPYAPPPSHRRRRRCRRRAATSRA